MTIEETQQKLVLFSSELAGFETSADALDPEYYAIIEAKNVRVVVRSITLEVVVINKIIIHDVDNVIHHQARGIVGRDFPTSKVINSSPKKGFEDSGGRGGILSRTSIDSLERDRRSGDSLSRNGRGGNYFSLNRSKVSKVIWIEFI